MNSKPASAGVLIIGAGLVTGLLIIFAILLDPGNEIGQFFKFLLASLFAFGLIFPKPGLYTLIAACGYFDLMKRLLVVADRVTFDDLTFVLGCPPVLLGGVLLGLFVQWANGKRIIATWNWACLLVVPFACAIAFLSNKLAGMTIKSALVETINGGFYAVMLVVVPLLFPTATALRKLLRFTAWVYLPVALYAIWQALFGLADFEVTYIKTGLTILIDTLAMGEYRPFSTLNSPTALGAVCSALAAMCFLDIWYAPQGERRWGRKTLTFLVGVVFALGWIASTSRSDGIIAPLALISAPLFMGRVKTTTLYFTLSGTFVILVLTSQYILESIDNLQYLLWSFTGISDDQFFNQMTRVGTYSDRLMGFSALTHDPRVWTLFGASQSVQESVHFHDPFTSLLLSFGVVPLLLVMAIALAMLARVHRRIWNIEDPFDRRLACSGLAVAVGFLGVSALSGNRLTIFPNGTFFWLLLSVTVTLAWSGVREPLPVVAPLKKKDPEPGLPQARGGRFRPVRRPEALETT